MNQSDQAVRDVTADTIPKRQLSNFMRKSKYF
jgi:hypothetical protein